ncbi:MAG: hypothetical protein Q7T16_04410 [Candidatus Burarchaeum sp.]|nr:hypothetical protein [Candidatus Burarchaeum sp.]MDO8339871.1 hypothetical protein [Candidatus Burarchaeum sp.]
MGSGKSKLSGIFPVDIIGPVKVPGGLLLGSEFSQCALAENLAGGGVAASKSENEVKCKPRGDTWLVQRLGQDHEFPFGDGYVYDGLNEAGLALLKKLLSFDYMGSSAFEWGAVPKAFSKIAEHRDENALICGEITVQISPNEEEEKKYEGKVFLPVPIFYFCNKAHEAKVVKFIKEDFEGKMRLQLHEPTYLRDTVANIENETARGWLEIDNGFMFFTDKEMFENMKKVFGL